MAHTKICQIERAKTNIAPSMAGLAEIMRINPIRFRRISNTRPSFIEDREEVGFSAQALQRVLPEAVMVCGFELADGTGGLDSDSPSLSIGIDRRSLPRCATR